MRVPISWLREFVALPRSTAEIVDRLAMLGFPVAGIVERPAVDGVVTGRIIELRKHPNADRLAVARVDVAHGEPLTIATAATNVAEGQTIAVATVGARLPGLTIARRTMRGVESAGMMISAAELALPADWFEDGIMQLDENTRLGVNAVELFGLDTDVLDVEITSNRPDAMSVMGLARELAASYGEALRLPSFVNPGRDAPAAAQAPQISLESPDCRRFIAQCADAIAVQPAPAWMRVRLALCGQRPINNLVDLSNYVMLEMGQPLHVYDAAAIGGGTLAVRDARDGERIETLDGVARTLTAAALVIADRDRPLCLAGLMGGAAGEVGRNTTAIVLEAANFNGPRIRRMSQILGLRTEASSRHEKSLAPALADLGAARAASLLRNLGATLYRPQVFGSQLNAPPPISLAADEVERVLGMQVAPQRISRHLTALGCEVAATHDETLSVAPPPWRRDLTMSADLIEEIARIEGYDRIPEVVPSVPAHDISSDAYERERHIATVLSGLGYRENITHSLQGAAVAQRRRRAGEPEHAQVEVRNPLSEEQRFLRSDLLDGLLSYLARNQQPARVFEIGEVFGVRSGGIGERSLLTFGFSADRADGRLWRDAHVLALKGDCETLVRQVAGCDPVITAGVRDGFHPGKTGIVAVREREVGHFGAVDPRLATAYDLSRDAYFCVVDVAALPGYETPRYNPPSKFPSTYRDLALVVGLDVGASRLEAAIAQELGTMCTGVRVFDEFRSLQFGADRKSLAVRVTLARSDATITDAEADAAIAALLDALARAFGAEIRA